MKRPGIVIAGGGPAGLTLALALDKRGWAPVVLDVTTAADERVLALSVASSHVFKWLGVWDGLPISPIREVAVHQLNEHHRTLGGTLVTAKEQKLFALGFSVPAANLVGRLRDEVASRGIECIKSNAQGMFPDGVHYGEGKTLPAKLLVWAHGSDPREQLSGHDYNDWACIARLSAVNLPGRAWELLTDHGVVVLIPEGEDNHGQRMAMICIGDKPSLDSFMSKSESAFCAWLNQQVTYLPGRPKITACHRRVLHAQPLRLRFRRRIAEHRQVWIGNAAQSLHIIAAQGLNVTLRDVWELSECLAADVQDPGELSLLRRYARGRFIDRFSTIALTDSLAKVVHGTGFKKIRGLGLDMTNAAPICKSFFVNRMLWGPRRWLL